MGEGKLLHMGNRTNPNRVYTMRGIEIFQKPLCREIRPMWGLPTRGIRLYVKTFFLSKFYGKIGLISLH